MALRSTLLALLAVSACGGLDGRPSVLLISIDTLRADHVAAYGYDRATTPSLDRLAAEGVLFEQHVSSSSWTLPGHASLFTSVPDAVHGCTDTPFALAEEHVTLAERFRERGWATGGFFAGPYLHPAFGLSQGFEHYENCTSYQRALDEGLVDEWAMDTGVMRASHQDVTNPTVYAAASRWIREHRERPFFAFVHLWDVHFDFIPPAPYDTRFDPAYAGPIDGRDFFFDPAINAGLSERDRQHLIALYDGEIAWTDSFVGKLLGELDELGLAASTVVAVTSDHGTEFFEHGGKGHRTTLFDELLHIPLILRAPGRLPAGARVAAQTRSIDVGPTLLELAGLPVPAGLAGSSLVGLARGQGLEFDNTSISELGSVGLRLRAVRTERVKLLRDPEGGRSLWFDLEQDPSELQPLVGPPGGDADLQRCARAEAELERAIRARPADPASAAVTQAVLRQLAELGYTDGADGHER